MKIIEKPKTFINIPVKANQILQLIQSIFLFICCNIKSIFITFFLAFMKIVFKYIFV